MPFHVHIYPVLSHAPVHTLADLFPDHCLLTTSTLPRHGEPHTPQLAVTPRPPHTSSFTSALCPHPSLVHTSQIPPVQHARLRKDKPFSTLLYNFPPRRPHIPHLSDTCLGFHLSHQSIGHSHTRPVLARLEHTKTVPQPITPSSVHHREYSIQTLVDYDNLVPPPRCPHL